MSGCHYCGTMDAELRPYGPGGAPICFRCMKAEPSREQAARQAFGALLDAAQATSPLGSALIGTEDGPIPLPSEDQLREVLP
jgi:hypothetical protein